MTKFKKLLPESIRYIVVHCAATPPDLDVGAKEIDLWHRQRGFARIGYHKVIRRDGTIEAGRELHVPGAHAQGFNLLSWGVCLIGGVTEAGPYGKPEANYTEAQYRALRGVILGLLESAPQAKVTGHRDLPSPHARLKECPCFDVSEWWQSIEGSQEEETE